LTLANLKVRTRRYLGFLSLIALAVVLAGVGSWGIDRLGGQVAKLEAVGANVQRVLSGDSLLRTIRRAQFDYLSGANEAAITETQDAETKANEVLMASAANTLSAERLAI
jgi:hypothetical protein